MKISATYSLEIYKNIVTNYVLNLQIKTSGIYIHIKILEKYLQETTNKFIHNLRSMDKHLFTLITQVVRVYIYRWPPIYIQNSVDQHVMIKVRNICLRLWVTSCSFEKHSNPAHGEVYSTQLYVIKFSELRQVGGFLRVFRFPPTIKLTATI